jgi:predicted FMN-binding regulatory protein PaiB
VIFYDYYGDVPQSELERFVQTTELGRLLTAGDDGLPHIGLYPFVYTPGLIEIHLNRKDEQLADLAREPRCVFELDEVLGVIPSWWIDPEDAVKATAYHQTVLFECRASVSNDGHVLAAQQQRLLARYQPEGRFREVAPDDPIYRGAIAQIAAVRLEITGQRVKFKLAQNRSPQVRATLVQELRKRGRRNDARAADAVQWTIDAEGRRKS